MSNLEQMNMESRARHHGFVLISIPRVKKKPPGRPKGSRNKCKKMPKTIDWEKIKKYAS